MKTTIYDLLGMIKDGKAPKKILFRGLELGYEEGLEDYFPAIETDEFNNDGLFTYLFDEEIKKFLNDEVEILETTITYNQDSIENNKQDKIRKLNLNLFTKSDVAYYFGNKINEIIEVINER